MLLNPLHPPLKGDFDPTRVGPFGTCDTNFGHKLAEELEYDIYKGKEAR